MPRCFSFVGAVVLAGVLACSCSGEPTGDAWPLEPRENGVQACADNSMAAPRILIYRKNSGASSRQSKSCAFVKLENRRDGREYPEIKLSGSWKYTGAGRSDASCVELRESAELRNRESVVQTAGDATGVIMLSRSEKRGLIIETIDFRLEFGETNETPAGETLELKGGNISVDSCQIDPPF